MIEVRDARVPLSSTCGHLEQLIQKKRRIIVLNKSDLIGQTDTERWVRHFTQQGQAVTFTSAVKGSRIGDLMPQELLKRGLLTRTDRILLFMIIGIPNTGKSTIINALRRSGMRASTVRPRGAAGADCKVYEASSYCCSICVLYVLISTACSAATISAPYCLCCRSPISTSCRRQWRKQALDQA